MVTSLLIVVVWSTPKLFFLCFSSHTATTNLQHHEEFFSCILFLSMEPALVIECSNYNIQAHVHMHKLIAALFELLRESITPPNPLHLPWVPLWGVMPLEALHPRFLHQFFCFSTILNQVDYGYWLGISKSLAFSRNSSKSLLSCLTFFCWIIYFTMNP